MTKEMNTIILPNDKFMQISLSCIMREKLLFVHKKCYT